MARRGDLSPVRSVPHDRRAPRGRRRSLLFPLARAARGIEREDSRALHLVADKDNRAPFDDRRDTGAKVTSRAVCRQFVFPQSFPREVVAKNTAGAEVRNDALAVGGGGRCRRAAFGLVEPLDTFCRSLCPPGFLAVGAAVRD